ncbi:phosphatase PAP2 family protein [Micromonospora sp. KC606]|uniref:phosphatase PAP2 family protein n=1 Tax=Micromonospora sp. KC606 TaxID=2530379 RepID=UPI0010497B86|nr:phosphatase PAP2 family protein [Micromonospora sp. KC606]TDC80713.1 phosphatase PAP2 family protein [Micromonospora sp. KC606]
METRATVRFPVRSWLDRRLDRDDSLGLRLTLAAAAAFLVLVPFALIAALVVEGWPPLHALDVGVTEAMHRLAVDNPRWAWTMNVWTDVFGPGPLRIAALPLVFWLWRRDARRLAGWVITTMAFGGLLNALLKLFVGRHRPDLLDPVSGAVGYAFPSGHALNATLAAGVLLVVFLPMHRDRAGIRVVLWSAALAIAGVTGLSRVALGVHWTSDVLAGWLLGAAVVAATSAAFAVWRDRPDHPTARSAPIGAVEG